MMVRQADAPAQTGLIFLHISKTAGMTMYEIISRQYPREAIYWVAGHSNREDVQQFMRMPEDQRRRYRCLIGHTSFGVHEYFLHPVDYLTILREPVDRIVSHYYYVKRSPDNYLHRWVTENDISLDEYVNSGHASELSNGQTRMLCGIRSMDSVFGNEPVTEAALEAAMRNLESIACIGLTERFDESLLVFQKRLGWKHIHYVKKNVTQSRSRTNAIPKETVRAIQEQNRLDMELYDYGRRLFEDRYRRYDIAPRHLVSFARRNRVYAQIAAAKAWVPEPLRKVARQMQL